MSYSVALDTASISAGVTGNPTPISVTPSTGVPLALVSWCAAINDGSAAVSQHFLQRLSRGTGTSTARTPELKNTRSSAASSTGAVNYTADATFVGNALVVMTARNVTTSSRVHLRRWVVPNPRYLPTAELNSDGWAWWAFADSLVPASGSIAFVEPDTFKIALPMRGRRGRNSGYFNVNSFASNMPALITAPLAPQFVVPAINYLQGADWPTQQAQDAQVFLNLLTAAAGGTLFPQECDEVLTVSDLVVRQPNKLLSETISLTDSLTKQLNRALAESIVLTDTLLKSTSRTLSENITLTDATSAFNRIKVMLLSESLNLSDTLTKQAGKVLLDNIVISDSAFKSVGRSLAETITLSDVLSTAKVKVIVLSESLTMSDSLSKLPTVLLAETLVLNDTFNKKLSRILSEAFSMVDSFTLVLLAPPAAGSHNLVTRIFHLTRNQGLSNKL